MYSRTERNYQPAASKDHMNPNLGPGCYNVEFQPEQRPAAYAPFCSLAPRVSFFEESIKTGPAPGSYVGLMGCDLTRRNEGIAGFGQSRSQRFTDTKSNVPGPGTYGLPSTPTIQKETRKGQKQVFNQIPVGVCVVNDAVIMPQINEPVRSEHKKDGLGPTGTRMALINRTGIPPPQIQTSHQTVSSIIWKRKYIPPSIPMGRYAFGYQENQEGDMVPRNPPVLQTEESRSSSFVEQSLQQNRGHRFGSGRNSGHGTKLNRYDITPKIEVRPGPNSYDPTPGEKYLHDKRLNAALMTLAPCRRITDEVVADAVKQGIPGILLLTIGPGSYELKAPLSQNISEPRNRIKLGGTNIIKRSYINSDMQHIPGPGAYHPESSNSAGTKSHKPQPFGSTTKRFASGWKAQFMPAPGYYEVAHSTAKAVVIGTEKASVFGSVEKRFVYKKPITQPGPAAYTLKSDRPIKIQKTTMESKAKMQRLFKSAEVFGAKPALLGPSFGTQADRFKNADHAELPPPGAYDISKAFETIKTKGRIESSALASLGDRVIFKGPGEYNCEDRPKFEKKSGFFLSNGERFFAKTNDMPGPGFYDVNDSSLVKKTFNMTLIDWNNQH